jgi:hypothetical protein
MSNFSKMCRRWVFTVCGEMNNLSAISRLECPSAADLATADSAFVRDASPDFGRSGFEVRLRTPSLRNRPRIRPASQLAPTSAQRARARSKATTASPVFPCLSSTRPRSSSAEAQAMGREPPSRSVTAESQTLCGLMPNSFRMIGDGPYRPNFRIHLASSLC